MKKGRKFVRKKKDFGESETRTTLEVHRVMRKGEEEEVG